ncbi:F-box/RNI-like superfamily protein [Thalictrum thalictroides]|uniref:F-box/RNI-like superfamily protein n=1 Tax=Thalictrum thalictroides TaxID=46969 RepID=A0A7J6VWE6_THATH|nr:F-box/RNI-like superfamily protein [Thalictrum thalictroides]
MSTNKKKKTVHCDRISALPDALIHLIFSYLDVTQVVQTSVLSKRWKSLWISNPYLNIQFHEWLGYDVGDYSWINGNFDGDEFKKFVDRVLLLRDGSNIHKFSFECQCYDDREYDGANQIGFCDWGLDQMDIWISSVIRRNVQEVKLQSLDISQSTLKSLVAQVKSLTLDAVRFEKVNDSESNEILMSSHVLEHLKLEDCDYNSYRELTISAPNLTKLMVIDDGIDYDGGTGSCVIKICAQNLKVLQIEGDMYKDYLLESLESLESAVIDIDNGDDGEDIASCLANILKGLYNTKSLTLSATPFQDYAEVPNVLNAIGLSFRNVRFLKFTNWRAKDCMSAIVKLLEKFTNLETLVMVNAEIRNWTNNSVKVKEWGAHLLSPHLKYIEIQEPDPCENGFKFLQYLLKNAAGLEKIVMAATSTQASETEKLLEFCKRLQVLPKASLRVKISLTHEFLSP